MSVNERTERTSKKGHIGIIGSGVIGLTCALVLSEAGYKVSILAREIPGDEKSDQSKEWASPWAAAAVFLHHTEDATNIQTQRDSFDFLFNLALGDDEKCGVQKVIATEYWDLPPPVSPSPSELWFSSVAPDFQILDPSSLPPGVKMGYKYTSAIINPALYLLYLKEILSSRHNVTFTQTEVQSLQEAKNILKCDMLVNASGLGAKTLAKDEGVFGIRGQTMLVDCPRAQSSRSDSRHPSNNTSIDLTKDSMIRRGTEYTYSIPRAFTSQCIIGGIIDPSSSLSTEVSTSLQADILRRVNGITDNSFAEMDFASDVKENIVAFRPDRKGGRRIEMDVYDDGNGQAKVVHAYGFGSSGYQYSYGSALRVKKLVDRIFGPRL